MSWRLISTLAAIVILSAAGLVAGGRWAPTAHADGDPASDVLYETPVFYPYDTPTVSTPLRTALDEEVASAAKAGFHVRVALIDSATDLGAIPELWAKPQEYADYLDVEIDSWPLLVVMPNGYGSRNLGAAATAAMAKLAAPPGQDSSAITQAAIAALPQLAAAAGHPIPAVKVASGGGSGPLPILLGAAVAFAAAGAAVLWWRRRGVPAGKPGSAHSPLGGSSSLVP